MKRWIVLFTMLGLLALVSCNDDDNSPTDPGDQNPEYDGTITATISGDLELEFDCATAYGLTAVSSQRSIEAGLMQIQGFVTEGADEYMIDIQVYHDPAAGTYSLSIPPVEGVATVAKNDVGNFSDSGSVTFTEVSASRLVGTFSFHAFRVIDVGQIASVDVTEGTFDVPVIEIED